MSLQLIIFDFGGVLMKTVDYAPRHTWDTKLGLTPGHVERIVHGSASWRKAQTGSISLETYRADIANQLHISMDDTQKLLVDFYRGDQLDMALVDYVRQLRAHSYRVALLSNDSIELADKLHQLNIAQLFNPLVISAQIGVMKPDHRAYEAVLEQAQCPPESAVFIDDMSPNIAGAEAVGIHGILYRDGMDIAAALQPFLDAD